MAMLQLLALAALLHLSLASSVLLGFSTRPHFLCDRTRSAACVATHPPSLPSSALSDLVVHLAKPSTEQDDVDQLPLARDNAPPALLLVVRSSSLRAEPSSVLRRLSVALGATDDADSSSSTSSSFHASVPASLHDLSPSSSANVVSLASVEQLLSLATDPSSTVFDQRDVSSVVSLSVEDERQDGLLAALEAVSRRARGDVAVLWAADRAEADADAPPANDADAPPANDADAADAADAPEAEDAEAADADSGQADAAAAADKAPDAEAPSSEYARRMYHPELTESQLAGLLVALVFLILFVPGFMCLWRIQPPQSFDSKMQ